MDKGTIVSSSDIVRGSLNNQSSNRFHKGENVENLLFVFVYTQTFFIDWLEKNSHFLNTNIQMLKINSISSL